MRAYKTRIPLPDEDYTELIGSALYVFNYNYEFIIQNIFASKTSNKNWHDLNGRNSKENSVSKELLKVVNNDIKNPTYERFIKLKLCRDRIVHGIPCTSKDGTQIFNTLDNNKK